MLEMFIWRIILNVFLVPERYDKKKEKKYARHG